MKKEPKPKYNTKYKFKGYDFIELFEACGMPKPVTRLNEDTETVEFKNMIVLLHEERAKVDSLVGTPIDKITKNFCLALSKPQHSFLRELWKFIADQHPYVRLTVMADMLPHMWT